VRALYRAREEVQAPRVRGGADRRVARVGERAGLAVAEARDVVFVAAECLVLGGFEFERAFFVGCVIRTIVVGMMDGRIKRWGTLCYVQNCWFMICQTISSEAMVAVFGWCCCLRERSFAGKVEITSRPEKCFFLVQDPWHAFSSEGGGTMLPGSDCMLKI